MSDDQPEKECPWGGDIGAVGRIRLGSQAEPGMVDENDYEWPTIDLLDGTCAYHIPESAMELANYD